MFGLSLLPTNGVSMKPLKVIFLASRKQPRRDALLIRGFRGLRTPAKINEAVRKLKPRRVNYSHQRSQTESAVHFASLLVVVVLCLHNKRSGREPATPHTLTPKRDRKVSQVWDLSNDIIKCRLRFAEYGPKSKYAIVAASQSALLQARRFFAQRPIGCLPALPGLRELGGYLVAECAFMVKRVWSPDTWNLLLLAVLLY